VGVVPVPVPVVPVAVVPVAVVPVAVVPVAVVPVAVAVLPVFPVAVATFPVAVAVVPAPVGVVPVPVGVVAVAVAVPVWASVSERASAPVPASVPLPGVLGRFMRPQLVPKAIGSRNELTAAALCRSTPTPPLRRAPANAQREDQRPAPRALIGSEYASISEPSKQSTHLRRLAALDGEAFDCETRAPCSHGAASRCLPPLDAASSLSSRRPSDRPEPPSCTARARQSPAFRPQRPRRGEDADEKDRRDDVERPPRIRC